MYVQTHKMSYNMLVVCKCFWLMVCDASDVAAAATVLRNGSYQKIQDKNVCEL